MNTFSAALWAETLKLRRSKVPLFTLLGFMMMPLVGGLFMVILKDPEAARQMGLIGAKAELTMGAADWPTFLNFMTQAVAAGGMVLFSIVTIWNFGREFSDHTVKELLALPTPREMIVTAKFTVVFAWCTFISLLVYGVTLLVGKWVVIPGWSGELFARSTVGILGTALLTMPLMCFAALLASAGRGYLPSFGWTFLTLALANFSAVMGWGDWFPWAIPGLFSGAAGPRVEVLGLHSYIVLGGVCILGFVATYLWWWKADQTR